MPLRGSHIQKIRHPYLAFKTNQIHLKLLQSVEFGPKRGMTLGFVIFHFAVTQVQAFIRSFQMIVLMDACQIKPEQWTSSQKFRHTKSQ